MTAWLYHPHPAFSAFVGGLCLASGYYQIMLHSRSGGIVLSLLGAANLGFALLLSL